MSTFDKPRHYVISMKAAKLFTMLQLLAMLSHAQSVCTDGATLDEEKIRSFKYGPVPNVPMYARQLESNLYKWAHPDPARVNDTEYIQGLINKVGENGTIYFHKGIYKISNLKLKSGFTLLGEAGSVFTGEEKLSNRWTQVNDKIWMYSYPQEPVAFNPKDKGGNESTECEDKTDLCKLSQDLFLNDLWQNRLASIKMLKKEGDWAFDQGEDGIEDNRLVLYTSSDPNNVTKLSAEKRALYDSPTKGDVSASRNLMNVKIFNIEFTNYIETPFTAGSLWIIANNTFKNNHFSGIVVKGNKLEVKWNQFNYNGATGIGASVKNSDLFENELAFNNQAKYAKGWNAGGMKSTATKSFKVYRNYVHDNAATGLWSDVFADSTTYHHNLLERNKIGIHYEISTHGYIHDNVLIDNTQYGIEVVSSSNVEVYNNTVKYHTKATQNGIVVVQDQRGYAGDCLDNDPTNDPIDKNPDDDQLPCNMQVHNVRVHHNYIKTFQPNNTAAGFRVHPEKAKKWNASGAPNPGRFYESYYNVKFDSNRYELAGGLAFFYWGWSQRESTTILTRWNWYNEQDVGACTNLLSTENLKIEVEGTTAAIKPKKNTGAKSETVPSKSPLNSYSSAVNDTARHVVFNVKVPQAGDYKIYARVLSTTENANPLWVKVNNGPWVAWKVGKYAALSWAQIGKERFFLKANNTNNTISFSYPKHGTELDKLYITANGKPL